MTRAENQAALEVCERATKGPWEDYREKRDGLLEESRHTIHQSGWHQIIATKINGRNAAEVIGNANFIALTRDPLTGYEAVLRENLRLREALEYMTQRLRNRGFIGSVELGNINSVGLNALGVPKQEKEPRYDLALDRRTIVGLLDKLNDANIRLEAAEQRATKAEADVKRLVEALGIYADERNFVEGNDWFWVGDDDPKCRARETLAAIATTKAQPAAEGSDAK